MYMKKILLFLLLLPIFQSMQAIELEPRTGFSNVHNWGLQMGAYVSFPTSNLFAIQTGALLYTGNRENNKVWNIGLNIPVYASFRIPVSNATRIRLNAGPYIGLAEQNGQLGVSAEAGVEFNRIYIGAGCFQNCFNEQEMQLNVSVGYKFAL